MPQGLHIPHLHRTLLPVAALYAAGVRARNLLFDRHLLPVEEFSVPVISVGNLTVGGTGKTPHIEWLATWLSQHYRVAVLSRGYKRHSHGFVLAHKGSTAAEIGDEPYQIFSKYPRLTVAVDANRRRGISRLMALPSPPQVILLDDAHQHRYVRPTFAIVLSDYNRPVYADLPLPAGRLREPLQGLQRADAIVITKCPHTLTPDEYAEEASLLHYDPSRLYASSLLYGTPRRLTDNHQLSLRQMAGNGNITVVTGIANPTPLMQYVRQFAPHATLTAYPDHHDFTPHEIDALARHISLSRQPLTVITTEKDAARLRHMPLPQAVASSLYTLPLVIEMQSHPGIPSLQQRIADAIEHKIRG